MQSGRDETVTALFAAGGRSGNLGWMADTTSIANEQVTTNDDEQLDDEQLIEDELLVEEISIDGMCGVY